MKANELNGKDLMVGNWVKPKNVDAYFRVGLIGVDSIWNDTDTHEWCYDELEPIPLTAEILSKCGFKKNKTGQWVIEKKHSIGCCGQTCSNTNPLEYAVWWDRFGLGCVSYLEKEGNMTLGGTTYVHQLQQVLRLFDLDKFIKIEL